MTANASSTDIKSILVVHSYHQEHFWTGNLKAGIDSEFEPPSNVRLFHEYMDAKRYPYQEYSQSFLRFLLTKYANTQIDALVISDDPAFALIRELRPHFFTSVPIIYLGINQVTDEVLSTPNMTGVFENRDIAGTIIDIKKQSKRDDLIIITDKTSTGLANLEKAKSVFGTPEAPSQIHIFDELIDDNIVDEFQKLSSKTPVLLIGQMTSPSRNEALLSWNEGTDLLVKWTQNPIYTIAITTLEFGALGADELDAYQHGQQAAELLKRLLNNVSIDDIKPVTVAQSQWVFNWEKMQEHNVVEQQLPENSRIVNQDLSFYQKYKLMVRLVASAFAVTIIIIVLLIELIRRGNKNRHMLEENESRYRDLAHAGANVFWETDTLGAFTYMSGDSSNFYGQEISNIIGKTLQQLAKGRSSVDFNWRRYESLIEQQKPLNKLIFTLKKRGKDITLFSLTGKPIYDNRGSYKGYRGISKDITQEHSLSEQLAYQAKYDDLTGLINRNSFNNRLSDRLNLYLDEEQTYLCFLDLDRFKLVNDTAGHLVGDAMLAEIAKLIESCVSEKEIIGRLGGDEFGLLIIGKTQAEAQYLCEKIISRINEYRFVWNQRQFNVGVSIGMIPIISDHSATELLSKADLCCYRAKDLGRGRVYFADLDNDDLYDEQLQMGYIANVAQAIEQNQFYLVKQRIKASVSQTNEVDHFEMLIRYRDEHGEVISPGLFIPAAEKHSVITLIDQWVLKTVLERYYEFFPKGNTQVSINLSGMSLTNDNFVQEVVRLLQSHKVPAHLICFEITETAAIAQIAKALEFIEKMKTLGVKFAIDDFGSGASSFSYLKNLPVDYLKIDGSLVLNIASDSSDRAIVEAIHAIAKMANMKTVAEFVENDAIISVLNQIGVDYMQGYGIEKPKNC